MAMSSNFPQNHRGGDSLSVRAINNGKMAIYNSWKKILNKLPTRQNSFLMLLLSTAKETSIIMPTSSIRKPRREILVLSLGTTPTGSSISCPKTSKKSWQIGPGRMETPGERGMMRIRKWRQKISALESHTEKMSKFKEEQDEHKVSAVTISDAVKAPSGNRGILKPPTYNLGQKAADSLLLMEFVSSKILTLISSATERSNDADSPVVGKHTYIL